MLEECPCCHNQVMFLTAVCPSCKNNRDEATPESLAEWAAFEEQRVVAHALQVDPHASVDQMVKEAKRQDAAKDLMYGAVWLVGGGLVSIFSYAAAPVMGGEGAGYMVFWGAMVYGAIRFLRGVFAMLFSSFTKG